MEVTKAIGIRRKLKRKKPEFKRQEGSKHAKLKDAWRKPRGRHSKLRQHQKARGSLPKPGYGSPRAARGLTRSGMVEVRVATPSEVSGIDSKKEAIIIAKSVGAAKRKVIIESAEKQKIAVLNK